MCFQNGICDLAISLEQFRLGDDRLKDRLGWSTGNRPSGVPALENGQVSKGAVGETDVEVPWDVAPLAGILMLIKVVIVRVPPGELIETSGEQHDGGGLQEFI